MGEGVRLASWDRIAEETAPVGLSPTSLGGQTIAWYEQNRRAAEQRNSERCWDDCVDATDADSSSTYSTEDPPVPWAKNAVFLSMTTPRILETIISNLNDDDARSALLVNRQWGAIATTLVWQDLSIDGLRRILSTVPDYRGELVRKC